MSQGKSLFWPNAQFSSGAGLLAFVPLECRRAGPVLLQRFVRPGSRPLPGSTIRPADCLAILGEFADKALLPALQGDELIGLGDPPSRQFPVLVNQEQDAPLLEDGARLVLLAVVQPLTRQHAFPVRLGGACEATQREQAPRSSHGLHQVPPLELLGHRTPPFRMRKRQPQARYGNNHRRKRTPRPPLPIERKAVTRVQRGCRWNAFQYRVAAVY